MINENNIQELINLELHRCQIAINDGRTRSAQKHLNKIDELNILFDTLIYATIIK